MTVIGSVFIKNTKKSYFLSTLALSQDSLLERRKKEIKSKQKIRFLSTLALSKKIKIKEENDMKMPKYLKCKNCNRRCGKQTGRKTLCRANATSILCDDPLLSSNRRLKLVCQKGNNKYYWLIGANTVIMRVEDQFCILIDHTAHICRIGKMGILLYELMQHEYHVYQRNNRDYVIRGINQKIAYDIQEIIHGQNQVSQLKSQGWTVDHGCETYNEKVAHTGYKAYNPNNGSHRVGVVLNTHKELNAFLDDVFESEKEQNGVYYDKFSGQKIKRGRKFVF